MKFNKICAVYWSATGTTRRIVDAIADELAEKLNLSLERFDFTLPAAREGIKTFDENSLVVFGTPVYAGRVPNVLLKYLATVQGCGAVAVPVVVYGNRNYDDALIELRDILVDNGFLPIAAGAFIGEHSFSKILAANRPDSEDIVKAKAFADEIHKKLSGGKKLSVIEVKGSAKQDRVYYQPRDRKGTPVNILKVKPLTDKEKCVACGLCAKVCPMGSINPQDVSEFTGICIKCGACVKKCPTGAKYYDDAGYLYHQHELEEGYSRRAEPETFI